MERVSGQSWEGLPPEMIPGLNKMAVPGAMNTNSAIETRERGRTSNRDLNDCAIGNVFEKPQQANLKVWKTNVSNLPRRVEGTVLPRKPGFLSSERILSILSCFPLRTERTRRWRRWSCPLNWRRLPMKEDYVIINLPSCRLTGKGATTT